MANNRWCYKSCPYGSGNIGTYCGDEDANGNCPEACECDEKADLQGLPNVGGPYGGGRPKPVRTGGMAFRGADGKLLEGKQEVLGMEVPKILIIAGVAVAAYFIVKKVK